MPFRIADLMISVLPGANENLIAGACNACTNTILGCFNPWTWCPLSWQRQPQQLQYSINELAILKKQLQQTLAEVETQEEAMKEMMRPQTVAEAQELEEKMVKALEELRSQKEELQKKAPKG